MFNVFFDYGMIPAKWLESIICPIPKGTQPQDDKGKRIPMNYRGISLLSCVFKIFSSILNGRIVKHLESNDILVEEQNGFRKGRSCTDHIL